MHFKNILYLIIVIQLLGSSSAAYGGVLISFSNATVVAGGLGLLDIEVSSNADSTTPDNLDSFALHLLLTPNNALGSLRFANLQSETHLAPGALNDQYLLHGDSFGETYYGMSSISSVSFTNYSGDTLDFLDATNSFQGVDLSLSSGSKLLFRVEFDATQAQVGDTFLIALIDDGNNRTLFSDSAFNPLTLDAGSFAPVLLTVLAPSTMVPEPSSTTVFLSLALVMAWRRKKQRLDTQQR